MTNSAARPPWSVRQLRVVGACNAAGAALVGIAWLGSNGESSFGDQVLWLNVAVVGLIVVCASNGGLFFLARRLIGRRRAMMLPDVVAATEANRRGQMLWVPGTLRLHREGCVMVRGKSAVVATAGLINAKRLRRCEGCMD